MIIRTINVLLIVMFINTLCYGQKKRDIIQNRVKSITEMYENVEEGRKAYKTGFVRYDRTGEVVEELKLKNSGNFDSHYLYEYNNKGNCKKETSLDEKGKILFYVEIEYDALGNKVTETQFSATGKKEKATEYKYNAQGMRSERIIVMPNGKVKSKKQYVYEFE